MQEYIEIKDGDTIRKLLILDTFGIEDEEYVSVLDEEKQELYIFKIIMEEDEVVFNPIEDEKELEDILAIYTELLDEEE